MGMASAVAGTCALMIPPFPEQLHRFVLPRHKKSDICVSVVCFLSNSLHIWDSKQFLPMSTYTIPFDQLDNSRVSEVGGKNASLGEMYKELTSEGLTIPDGFATTATAYKEFLEHNALHDTISEALSELDVEEFSNLKDTGKKIRTAISEAEMPGDVAEAIREAYRDLESREEQLGSVAVRSSATAEDLPEASFAGQHDSFMNISGEEEVLKAVQRCIASLFTDRAIKYREDNGFDHMKVALSAGVQKMVRSDKACAGVAFSIDPDSGFGEVIFINGSWGLGDNVVGGVVNADQFYVSKTLLERDKHALIHKSVGTKKKTLVNAQNGGEATTENVETPEDRRNRFILSDDEVLKLGHWAMIIEKHYDMPMDIEWAKDGNSEELYIVQARPETVHAADEDEGTITEYSLVEKRESDRKRQRHR
jgi:pyruvate,water dikinase